MSLLVLFQAPTGAVALASTVAGTATTAGALTVSQALAATVAGMGTAVGALVVSQTLASVVAGAGTAVGDLTVAGALPEDAWNPWRPGRHTQVPRFRLGTVEPRWLQSIGRGRRRSR